MCVCVCATVVSHTEYLIRRTTGVKGKENVFESMSLVKSESSLMAYLPEKWDENQANST